MGVSPYLTESYFEIRREDIILPYNDTCHPERSVSVVEVLRSEGVTHRVLRLYLPQSTHGRSLGPPVNFLLLDNSHPFMRYER